MTNPIEQLMRVCFLEGIPRHKVNERSVNYVLNKKYWNENGIFESDGRTLRGSDMSNPGDQQSLTY